MNTRVVDSAYKVFCKNESGHEFRGTAFAVSPKQVVTCHHVIDQVDPAGILIFKSNSDGFISRLTWKHFDRDGFDFSIGTLPESAPHHQTWLGLSPIKPKNFAEPLTIYGFASETEGLDEWEDRVSGLENSHGLVKLQNSTRKGVSGGPALDVKNRTVGITVARRCDGAQKYVLPVADIFGLLEAEGIRAGQDGLLSIPVGPMVRIGQVPHQVIEVFAQTFHQESEARMHIARAMRLSAQNNPEGFEERQIIVLEADMPSFSVPRQFWFEIFDLAGRKSRRCLGSLLHAQGAPNPQFFESDQRVAYLEFEEFLHNS